MRRGAPLLVQPGRREGQRRDGEREVRSQGADARQPVQEYQYKSTSTSQQGSSRAFMHVNAMPSNEEGHAVLRRRLRPCI